MRWRGYLYINGSKTYDAIISSKDKFAIMQYVMTMVDDNDDFRVVVQKVKDNK
jgi:hypothetical protein